MRSSLKVLFVVLVALGGVVIGALPGVGQTSPPTNTLIIRKDVTGDPAPGTTFTVRVTCESILAAGATALPFTSDVTFDEEGVGVTAFAVPAGSRCTATETADGGASSTAYACEIHHAAMNDEPPFEGNCTGDNQVTFGDVVDDRATLTVYNTFPLGQTAAPGTSDTPVAQAVQAAPAFTG